MRYFIVLLFLITQSINSSGQISFNNPSFEDQPGDATVPMGWFPCQRATTPDILPGFWGVYLEPSEGDTYVGLITRENSSFESIGQRLSGFLEEELCYTMSLDLAHSDVYSGYNEAIGLRIWISDKKCGTSQLVHQFSPIESEDWKRYNFQFKPKIKANYILIEAFASEGRFTTKGNILMDNLSSIFPCGKT